MHIIIASTFKKLHDLTSLLWEICVNKILAFLICIGFWGRFSFLSKSQLVGMGTLASSIFDVHC